MNSKKEEALQGIRVLDFSRGKAGPTCGQILADMGAEVIKVERPGGDFDRTIAPFTPDGQSFYLAFTCRNKKGITLNLKKQRGREIFKELLNFSDIIIENYGPQENKKLGFDYKALREIKQDIIVVAVSSFGQYGPYAERNGFDGIAQAMSGVMWVTGFPDDPRPIRLGVTYVDTAAGVYGALGAVLALHYRERTGKGQLVDVSLLDTAMSFMESIWGEYKVVKQIRPRVGNANVLVAPYDSFQAKDGWVFIAAPTNSMWKALCKIVGSEELIDAPGFQTIEDRSQPEKRQFFEKWLGTWASKKTVSEVVSQLNEAGIACGPVYTIPEVISDPQVQAREMIVEIHHSGIGKIPLTGIPIKFSETPGEIKSSVPAVGEHNQQVYHDLLGLTSEQLLQLEQEGVI